ncbi:unnamed protein product, partial [Amoebophrya sp. A120]
SSHSNEKPAVRGQVWWMWKLLTQVLTTLMGGLPAPSADYLQTRFLGAPSTMPEPTQQLGLEYMFSELSTTIVHTHKLDSTKMEGSGFPEANSAWSHLQTHVRDEICVVARDRAACAVSKLEGVLAATLVWANTPKNLQVLKEASVAKEKGEEAT